MEAEKDANILTVSQLTQAIKLSLEATFPHIQLQAEVSNFKKQASGHLYFSLKDANAQIGAVMFRGDASRLKQLPKDGDEVIITGEINVYPPSGRYQIVVRTLRLAGLGELLLKLEELKQKIHQKGWFKPEHKQPLPKFPKRIGVVTSPTGAALQDMLNVLTRRTGGFELILNPVRVQGTEAAGEIAEAIDAFNRYNLADVLIIGRGGGSIEDLWAFNEEIVAEAVFNSKIPIIAAVGHETDHCIAEYVADVRAPTPSAAAEIVMAEKAQQLERLEGTSAQLERGVRQLIRHDRQRLDGVMRHPMLASPYNILGTWMQKLDDTRGHLDIKIRQLLHEKLTLLAALRKHVDAMKPTAQIGHFRQQLLQFNRNLTMTMNRSVALRRERLESVGSALGAINPKNLLTKGYSILFSEKDRSIITSVQDIHAGDAIRTLVYDGEIASVVKEVSSHDKKR